MKTSKWMRQIAKSRFVVVCLIAAVVGALELWALCHWHRDFARENTAAVLPCALSSSDLAFVVR